MGNQVHLKIKARLSFLALVLVPVMVADARADMRGQVVCGVPADEAVLLTQQLNNGSWRIWTPAAGSIRTFSTEADAIGLWEQQNPAFVCEVTIQVNFREFTGRFYRLNRKMQQHTDTPDGVTAGENDPRRLIVGVRTHAQGDGYCGLPKDEPIVVTVHEISPEFPGIPARDRWKYYGPYEASVGTSADNEVTAYALARWGHGWETYKPDPMMPSSPHYIFFQDSDGRTTTGWKTYKLDPGIKPYFSWKAFRLYRLSEPVDEGARAKLWAARCAGCSKERARYDGLFLLQSCRRRLHVGSGLGQRLLKAPPFCLGNMGVTIQVSGRYS